MHLQDLIERTTKYLKPSKNGTRPAALPMAGLLLVEQDEPSAFDSSLYEPVLCLVLQGRKQVSLGEQTLSFGPGECLLVSHQLHVRSRVTKAPYRSLIFQVDVATIRRLYDEVTDLPLDVGDARSAETHRADPELMDALARYLALGESAANARVLGPLASKEIHYRLLTAPFGGMLRSLIRYDSKASAITRAIGAIRRDMRSPIVIGELAREVGMSVSAFHKHFKTITSTTPLQFQKELRLLEARRLLRSGTAVTTAAYDVGYQSPSQFSREYVRKFGVPPSDERTQIST